MTTVTVESGGKYLTLNIDTASYRFHAIWLRDNAQDPQTRSPKNGQRLISLLDISPETYIANADICDSTLRVRFMPEAKIVDFDIEWLSKNSYDANPDNSNCGWLHPDITTWDGSESNVSTSFDFTRLHNDRDYLRDWLTQIARLGIARISGGPVQEQALFKVVELFGYIRETNYGRHFDVRLEVNPNNLAYTGLALQAHTDNPYRDPIPTIQVLYCLDSSAEGGDNMVVDGFRAAQRLAHENTEWFDVLSNHCAKFEFQGEAGVSLQARKPIIELAPDGELIAIRFNNRSTAAITDVPFDKMEIYYMAYRRFAEIIDDPAMASSFRLEPGDCFVVDNTRVLHARKAYSGYGSRWIQGCYADKDALLSTLYTLNTE